MKFLKAIRRCQKRAGFTLIELLLTISIIASLFLMSYGRVGGWLLFARETRARAELNEIATATHMWVLDEGGEWPEDADRSIPPGVEEYLGPGNWPDAPWPGSVYDWDTFMGSNGNPVYQISIRFCPLGQPGECLFPDEPWAENFDYHSSFYYCMRGKCRAHPGKPDSHPGYCVNC